MLLQLDFSCEIPIYMQIRNQIVLGIANQTLLPGERLPTIRALANEAGINMMTVNKAYQLLKQEGYILADRRNGAVVNGRMNPSLLSDKMKSGFRLLISEAKLNGFSKEDVLKLCGELYDEREDPV